MTTPRRAKAAPKLDFEVTREHIDQAIPRDSGHCMIADALAAAIPTARYITVDLATIRWTDRAAGWRYIYLTPRAAQEALLAFDDGTNPPQPFRVKIRAAQMVPTGTARKARTEPGKRTRATLEANAPGNTIPAKIGGNLPPLGPAATGAGSNQRPATGRRREYGLRAFVR